MRQISIEELNDILKQHDLWLKNDGGVRADLSYTDLSYTDLFGSDLRGVDLRFADLSGSDLREADLREASINWPIECPEKGSFIGFKKARTEISNYIVELEIQADSERCSATSRKCRCSKAKVISITNLDGSQTDIKEVVSSYDKTFKYKIGEIVEVANFDPNRWNECSSGIHFFITRQEAVDY